MSSAIESIVSVAVEAVEAVEVESASLKTVLAALEEFECADLFKVIKKATLEAEKQMKSGSKIVAKKAGSAPKGVQPPQLRKPRRWVEATLEDALANGWEKFVAKKGKEEIEYPASIEHEGAWIFPDSIDEKNPSGKQIIMAQAMSLSAQRWTPKTKKGTHQELYEQFSAEFDAANPVEAVAAVAAAPAVRKTAAEKAVELAEAKRVKEEEKAVAKAAKELERANAKAAKEAEKVEAKRVKDLEKAAAKASKIPAAAIKAAPKAAVVKAAVVKAAKPTIVKPEEWSCPADGSVRPWVSNGIKYLRNSDHQLWLDGGDDLGAWQGVVDPATNKIDTSVPEPSFDDEE
jgi:hypothetical protein